MWYPRWRSLTSLKGDTHKSQHTYCFLKLDFAKRWVTDVRFAWWNIDKRINKFKCNWRSSIFFFFLLDLTTLTVGWFYLVNVLFFKIQISIKKIKRAIMGSHSCITSAGAEYVLPILQMITQLALWFNAVTTCPIPGSCRHEFSNLV